MGKGFKKALKGIGKVAGGALKFAAPLAGLIPGVGIPLAAGLGAGAKLIGRTLSGQKTFGQGAAGDVLTGAGGGAVGAFGAGQAGGPGKLLGNIGKTIGKTFTTPEGGLDVGRIAGAGMGVSNLLGARAQRKTAQSRLGSEDALRNMIISRLTQQPQYDFTPGT